MSKIIQKEKEQQNEIYKKEYGDEQPMSEEIAVHKQSLINLKEYLEQEQIYLGKLRLSIDSHNADNLMEKMIELKEDIKELKLMIRIYEQEIKQRSEEIPTIETRIIFKDNPNLNEPVIEKNE